MFLRMSAEAFLFSDQSKPFSLITSLYQPALFFGIRSPVS